VKELNLGGIFVSPFVGDLAITLVICLILRRVSRRLEIERRVWHPQLFNLCVFLIILSVIALLPL
jgi:predicted PurR-regulated permease PerM